MIWRFAAAAGAVAPVVARAADKAAPQAGPVVWHFLGNPFEAGSMIAALCACFAVRFYVVSRSTEVNRWVLDIPVSALCLMFTGAGIIATRPEPLSALLMGTGLGAIGAGIIRVAEKRIGGLLGEVDKS